MKSKLLNRILISIVTTLLLSLAIIIALINVQGGLITEQGIIQTGGIRINSIPSQNVNVFIDGEQKQLQSQTINGLVPGNYELRISKDGYRDWTQTVTVRGQLLTNVDAQLLPENLNQSELFINNNIDSSFTTDEGNYIYYVTKTHQLGSNVGIWKAPMQNNTGITLISEQEVKISNINDRLELLVYSDNFRIIPSPNNSRVILTDMNFVYIIDANGLNTPSAEDLVDIDFPIINLGWVDNDNLWIETDNLLVEYDINSESKSIVSYQENPIYSIDNNKILFLNDDLLIYNKNAIDSSVILENLDLPTEITALTSRDSNSLVYINDNSGNLFLLYTDKSSLVNIGEYKILSISPNSRILLAEDNEGNLILIRAQILLRTGVIDISKYEIEDTDILTDTVQWSKNSSRLYFVRDSNRKQIATMDSQGNNSLDLIGSNTEVSNFFVKETSILIPYLQEDTNYTLLYEYVLEQIN